MSDLGVLSEFEILQDGSRGHHAILQVVDTKSFQRLGLEMAQQFLTGCHGGEHPIVEFEHTVFCTKIALKIGFSGTVVEHLLGLEITNEFFHIVVGSLTSKKLTRGNIEKSHATRTFSKMYGSQKVVLLVVEHIVAHGHTRGHQFGNAALHQGFGEFGVFQLVANGHPASGTNQFGQVSVERMVWKSGHFGRTRRTAIVTAGKGNTQNLGCGHRILAIGLIEVTTTKEHQRVGMFRLQREKLLHHRGKSFFLSCHNKWFD